MHLHSPTSAILSAVIFNALIIPALIPVALRGVKYRAVGADALLRRNLLIWGLGGVILPFVGIKLIDMIMVAFHFVEFDLNGNGGFKRCEIISKSILLLLFTVAIAAVFIRPSGSPSGRLCSRSRRTEVWSRGRTERRSARS